MSINKLFAVLQCQRTTPNRLRGEARNGRRATYVRRSRRPDGDLRDKPGCVPASGCTKGAPWRISRCIGPDGSPVGGAQQRRLSPYLVSQEEKPSKSARGAGPPGTRKARRDVTNDDGVGEQDLHQVRRHVYAGHALRGNAESTLDAVHRLGHVKYDALEHVHRARHTELTYERHYKRVVPARVTTAARQHPQHGELTADEVLFL